MAKKIWSIISAILITAAVLTLPLSFAHFDLIPDWENIAISPYTDGTDSTNSRIRSYAVGKNGIMLNAELGSKELYPIAGISLSDSSGDFIDLSPFDMITVITDSGCSDFNLTITVFEQTFSTQEKRDTHRYFQLEYTVNPAGDTIHIPFRELPTPAWWYSMNDTRREQFGKPDFSLVSEMIFSNHPDSRSGDSVSFLINNVTFHKRKLPAIMRIVAAILICGIGFLLIHLVTRKVRTIAIVPQDVSEGSRTGTMLRVIAESYSDPQLSINSVSEKCGLSPYHIRKALQEKCGLSFKEYLKEVRITEARRLLTETTCDIKEISWRVGFAHASSFTRAFKEDTGMSPSAYRSENSRKSQ